MVKKLLLISIYCFAFSSMVFHTAFSQAQKMDSLQKELIKTKIPSLKIKLYNQLAIEYYNDGKPEKAKKYYEEVLKLAIKDYNLQSATYNEIGNIQSDLGENEKAFKSYQTALKILADKDLSLQAKINKNVGALFLSWKKLDEALKYYLVAETLAMKAGDKRTVADLSNNKGTVYEQRNLYDKAQISYNKALNFYLKNNIYDRIALTYNNLAILNKVQKKFSQSVYCYQKSVDNALKANNKWLSAAIGNNLGNLLSEMNKYDEGDAKLQQALSLEKEIDAKELIQETLENLGDNEKRRGNFKLAYQYLKDAATAKNNFINTENTKEVAKLKEQYEAEKKEKKIELLNKESKIQNLTLSERNQTIKIIIALFLGVIIISYLVFSRYQIKQKSKLKLVALETKHQVQEEKLRISRELHDNIGAQLSFINGSIQNMASADIENEQLQQTQKITQNTIKELRSTVYLINQQEFCLEEFVVKLREYLKPYYGGKPNIVIQCNTDKNYILEPIIATNLFRIIQEAVNNTKKYADASVLEVDFSENDNGLEVNIIDDGVGFETENNNKGYGLKNMDARVKNIGGKLQIFSGLKQGTKIKINIPIQA